MGRQFNKMFLNMLVFVYIAPKFSLNPFHILEVVTHLNPAYIYLNIKNCPTVNTHNWYQMETGLWSKKCQNGRSC